MHFASIHVFYVISTVLKSRVSARDTDTDTREFHRCVEVLEEESNSVNFDESRSFFLVTHWKLLHVYYTSLK